MSKNHFIACAWIKSQHATHYMALVSHENCTAVRLTRLPKHLGPASKAPMKCTPVRWWDGRIGDVLTICNIFVWTCVFCLTCRPANQDWSGVFFFLDFLGFGASPSSSPFSEARFFGLLLALALVFFSLSQQADWYLISLVSRAS